MPLGGASGSRAIGAMIKARGEEFVRKLKEQQIKLYSLDAPALVNVIAAGEVAASPAVFQSHTWLAASKGAAVEWLPMDLVPNNVGSAAIALRPPNPHGAILVTDFLLSPDGQKVVLEKFLYGEVRKGGRLLGEATETNRPKIVLYEHEWRTLSHTSSFLWRSTT
jgi:ABC-type Fe3+ transport system substrate-binding protein